MMQGVALDHRRFLAGIAALSIVMVVTAAPGQDSPAANEEAPVPAATGQPTLADQQEIIRDRVGRLEDRMFELSKVLEKTEPDHAAKLREALGAARSMTVREKMSDIAGKLRKDRFSDAADGQKVVSDDLQQLLRLLLEEPDKTADRKKEIERLAKLREDLENIIKEQEKEKADAEAAQAAQQQAEALEAAAGEAKELLGRQKAATGRTGRSDRAPDAKKEREDIAREQGDIRQKTEELAKRLEAAGSPGAEAGETGSPSDQDAEGEGSESQGEKGDESSKSEGASGQSGQSGGPSAAGAASRAAGDLNKAAGEMKSAEDQLGAENAHGAKSSQEGAEENLQHAIDKLEKEARELRNRFKLEDQAEAQQKTAEKTKELADEMKGGPEAGGEGSKGGEKGDQKSDEQKPGEEGSEEGSKGEGGSKGGQSGGQQGGQKGGGEQQQGEQDQQPAPGQQDVEGAIPLQEDASKDLKNKKPEDAVKKQEQALQKLQQAKDQLEDVLEQLRKEQQEELLAALEARFRAMLAQQLECNKQTNRLGDLGQANWKRSDQLELADLAQKQRWVGTQADATLQILVEEGTTVVFPQLIEQVRDDALTVADRLGSADTGRFVRVTQAELEQAIRDLLEAVKQLQKENEEGGGGGGGGGGNNPLLPGSAELKLLRACQLRVNSATETLEVDRVSPEVASQDVAARLDKLSKRQQEVAKMAKDMHETLRRAQ